MPPEFGYPHKSDLTYGYGRVQTTDLWVPLALTPQQKAERDNPNGFALARLTPGVTVRQAQAEMTTVIMSHLNLLHNPYARGWSAYVKPFRDSSLGPVRPLMLPSHGFGCLRSAHRLRQCGESAFGTGCGSNR